MTNAEFRSLLTHSNVQGIPANNPRINLLGNNLARTIMRSRKHKILTNSISRTTRVKDQVIRRNQRCEYLTATIQTSGGFPPTPLIRQNITKVEKLLIREKLITRSDNSKTLNTVHERIVTNDLILGLVAILIRVKLFHAQIPILHVRKGKHLFCRNRLIENRSQVMPCRLTKRGECRHVLVGFNRCNHD